MEESNIKIALEILAKKSKKTVDESIESIKEIAVEQAIQPIIDDAIERIRRQKMEVAKMYVPTEEEINDYLTLKLNSKIDPGIE